MVRVVLLFLLFLSTVLCSIFTDAIGGTVDDALIEKIFKFSLSSPNLDKNKSIFSNFVTIFSSNSSESPATHYARFAKSLYDYMDRTCLTAIVSFNRKELDFESRFMIMKKICLSVHEINFFERYNGKFKIPERSVMIMLRTVKLLEPDLELSHPLIQRLGEFCIIEPCQKLVYDAALPAEKKLETSILSIKINRSIEKTCIYDKFLKKCFEFLDSCASKVRKATAENLTLTIINSPYSEYASETLIEVLKQHPRVFSTLANDKKSANSFADFVARTRIADKVILLMKPEMNELKDLVLKISQYYAKIQNLMTFSWESVKNNDVGEFLGTMMDDDLFTTYIEIDKPLIHECFKKMLDEIPAIIEFIQSPTTEQTYKINVLKLLLMIITQGGLTKFKGEILYDFEPLMDILISSDIYKCFEPFYMAIILSPPFSKLEKTHLQKLFSFYERIGPEEGMELFTRFSCLFLRVRLEKEDIFWNTLNIMHEFYQENQLGISQIFETLLITQSNLFDVRMTQKLIEFCKKHKLLSKTFEKVARTLGIALIFENK